MSEPSSLYMRVSLTEKNFENFKNSLPVLPNFYNDWLPWLSSKKYYGNITDDEIQKMTHQPDDVKSVGDYVSFLTQDIYAGPSQSLYDAASNTWTLCIAGLSENYKEFISVLSILRGVEKYKDLPGEDFILIYPYFWLEHPEKYTNAYVVIRNGESRIVNEIPAKAIDEANQALGKMIENFRSSYDDADL